MSMIFGHFSESQWHEEMKKYVCNLLFICGRRQSQFKVLSEIFLDKTGACIVVMILYC